MFKSRTIFHHLIKGVCGFGLLALGLNYAPALGWWTAVPLIGALVCFRGCPMCWTLGLVETALDRNSAACVDGSCSTQRGPSS